MSRPANVRGDRWRVTRWKQPGSRVDGLYFCRDRRYGGDEMRTCGRTHLTREEAKSHAAGLNLDARP